MPEGRKILITGPAGQIAFPMARELARRNEVWGIARFSDPASRREVEQAGIRTLQIDLEKPDFSELPRDFTHLLHLAATVRGDDYDGAIRTNAEGTGLLLSHCRRVEAALVMSTVSVYKPNPDPWHLFHEDDPLGDIMLPFARSYSISKIAEEAVARFCAREFKVPITIARMGASYGPRGGLPIFAMQALAAGRPVSTRFDPCPYSPIHDDDMLAQVKPLIEAASVPATIVNWAGDEVASIQEMVAYGANLLGVEPRIEVGIVPGASIGSAADPTRRKAITGPCCVAWRDGIRRVLEELYPDRVRRAADR
ncbi:NAD(P)-dependent oxidoreductase [Myxococcota bacterium]|nr:NAD(P)-dependent oxidoreductase [Myxococcota bacterium]